MNDALRRRRAPNCRSLWPAVALLLCAASATHAAETSDEGVVVGKWLLIPYAWAAYEYDNNVLRTNEARASADNVTTLTGGLSALLPFRQSLLELSLETEQVSYANHAFTRDSDNEIGVDLTLNFSRGDTLVISDYYLKGFNDVNALEDSEVTFDGVPFDRNVAYVELSRSIPREKGYYVGLSYVTTEFDEDEPSSQFFYDYSGFDGGVEYRQPLSSYKWLVAYYGLRRFDHFIPGSPRSQPYRREVTDNFQIGLRGVSGRGQPFVVRLGYGRFRYEFPIDQIEPLDTKSWWAFARWRLLIGGGTRLLLTLDHEPRPSQFFNSAYANTQIRVEASRQWLRESEYGLRLRFNNNQYENEIYTGDEPFGCGFIERHDKRYEVGVYAEWAIHRRMAYTMEASYELRRSNCFIYDFDATNIAAGISFGWF